MKVRRGRIRDHNASEILVPMAKANSAGAAVPVGTRVQIVASAGGGAGFVVEDFGPQPAGGAVRLDADTSVRARRYAVAVDGGRLVFADASELHTVDHPS